MQGFFSKKETTSMSSTKGIIHSCAACGLYQGCQSPKMKPFGKFEKQIMCIGEYPDWVDDEKGKPWQGKAGRLLRKVLEQEGIDLFRDCISLNAVNCKPKDRVPKSTEVDHCRSVLVWKALMKYQPKVVLLFGSLAVDSIIGYRTNKGGGVSKWRGWQIPDQEIKSWVCPTFDPGYILHKDKSKDLMTIWQRDIQQALQYLDGTFPRYKQPTIEIVDDCKFLNDWTEGKLGAFDYETTGLKPHDKGHQIACVSIADREDHVWVFPAPRTKKGWQPFRKWLNNKRIPKMGHNVKFETAWSREILKVSVNGWEWDSMIAAHVLDNRTGVTSLKFQTYANFGIGDWSGEVDAYLKSNGNSANEKNRVMDLMSSRTGAEKLMTYCGLDSAYEYRLAIKQMEELNWDFLPF